MDPSHSLLIIVAGKKREIVTRPGHLDLNTARAVAAAAGGTLHVMRHLRTLPEPGRVELVRIIEGEDV